MADRFDQLAPRDLLITLRSIPRRLAETLDAARADSRTWAKRDQPQADGVSLTDTVVDMGLALAGMEAEVTKMVTHTEPVIWRDVMDEADPARPDGPPMDISGAEELATSSAVAIADRLDHHGGDDWARSVPMTGGGTVSMMQLGQHAARVAINRLQAVERKAGR